MICDKVAWNSNLASPFIVLARKWRESLVMLKFSPHSQLACPICIVTPNLEESDEVVYTLRRQHTSTHFQPLEKGTGRIAELASTQSRLSIRICMPRRKSFLSGKFRHATPLRKRKWLCTCGARGAASEVTPFRRSHTLQTYGFSNHRPKLPTENAEF